MNPHRRRDDGDPLASFGEGDQRVHVGALQHRARSEVPVTKTTGSRIARLDDTCGNVIQLTQLE